MFALPGVYQCNIVMESGRVHLEGTPKEILDHPRIGHLYFRRHLIGVTREGMRADMMKFIINLPIFRRLFMAFALATVLPGVVIVLLGTYYLNSLDIQGQAVRTSFDAQSVASQEQINLERMNALLQTRHTQIFASLGGVVQDPSLNASGALINTDILAREADFDQTLPS